MYLFIFRIYLLTNLFLNMFFKFIFYYDIFLFSVKNIKIKTNKPGEIILNYPA